MKKSFQLYIDSLCVLDDLTIEQKGQLFDAIYKYQLGQDSNLSGIVKVAFSPMRAQFERDNEKYSKVCERNQKIAKDRWDTKSTTRTVTTPTVTRYTDKDKDKDKDTIREIVENLNLIGHSNYKPTTTSTITSIKARLSDGFTIDDFKKVHRVKYDEWKDSEMIKHFNPTTLYRAANFEKYLNQKEETEQIGGVTW